MPATTRPLYEQIDTWMKQIDMTKTASEKPASVKKAGPSGMGESTHPSKKVDDNTHAEQTGARFDENTKDVKRDVPGMAVDETDPKGGGTQDDKQFNIGTQQSATGEDPSVEDDYKGTKDDPGTSHPADAESTGVKYSSMQLPQLLKIAEDKAHAILADLANGITTTKDAPIQQKVASIQPAAAPAKPAPAAFDTAAANTDMEKYAADFIARAIQDAECDADLVGAFWTTYAQTRNKLAADEASEGEDHAAPADAGAGPEAAQPAGDVLSALGAGGAGPDAGAGAPPEAPPGGADGGGMSQEHALQELAMALQELGISPEELAHMAEQHAGGAGGPPPGGPPVGPPPGAGGPPELPPGAAGEMGKLAAAARSFKRSGRFRFEEAKTAAQRQARDQIKDYILEITGNKI